MTILATIWLITKWLIIFSVASALIVSLIGLFHPLRFNLNLRGSIKGQKAELWFVYLFRIIKVGVIATPHTQDVVLKIFFWKKILQRNQRIKPTKPGTTKSNDFPENQDGISPVAEEAIKTKEQRQPETPEKKQPIVPEDITPEASNEEVHEEPIQAPEIEVTDKPELLEPVDSSKAEVTQPEAIKSGQEDKERGSADLKTLDPDNEVRTTVDSPREEINTEPLHPVSEVDPFATYPDKKKEDEEKAKPTGSKKEPEQDSFRTKLRKLKKRASEKYGLGKKWLKIVMRKYNLLSPIIWKFWARSKKGFKIENPTIACRYALHEPYLTGMFQGNLAILSGILQGFGVNFVPVPVFSSPTLYTKGKASAVILPWRFMFAFFGLVFERILWSEAWKLFKWYRATKSSK